MRGLYAAWALHRPATENALGELRAIGQDLRSALDLASRCEPDTVGHRAAWAKTDNAIQLLGHLIGDEDRVREPVGALVKRLRG